MQQPNGPDGPSAGDEVRFLRSWAARPLVIGAVSPSGRALARLMASHVDPAGSGPVVELGPGTGVFTRALLERGVAPERLVLIEYSEEFCALLAERFPGVRIVNGDAYAVRDELADLAEASVEAVMSGLPLLTRPVAQRAALLEDCFALLKPGAPFVQFTYGISPPVPRGAVAARIEESRRVWWNLPPAKVFAYRAEGARPPA